MAISRILSLPAVTTGLIASSGSSSWSYGSWIEISPSLGRNLFAIGISYEVTNTPALDTTQESLLEIGTGAIGSETAKLQLPFSIRNDTQVDYYLTQTQRAFFPEPYFIPAGERISVRFTDSLASAVTYQNLKILYQGDDSLTESLTDDFSGVYKVSNEQNSTGTSFGFGQWASVRYRGQRFTPSSSGKLTKIGFDRTIGSQGIKVYIDTITSNAPTNAVGSELYSFTITNANVIDQYGEYDLPVPLAITGGTEYCFYLAPWDTSGNAYSDDYADVHGTNSGAEITNNNGTWSTENLSFKYKVYVDDILNTERWIGSSAGSSTVGIVSNQLKISMPSSATSSSFSQIYSIHKYDLTGSFAQAKIDEIPNVATNAYAYMLVYPTTASTLLEISVEAGTIYYQYQNGGAIQTLASGTYNATTHKYWKIREASGTIYWETSEDGVVWTNRASWTNAMTITAMSMALASGCYQNETNAGNFIVDNFNVVSVNDSRSARVIGAGTIANNIRLARLKGKSIISDIRSSRLKGKTTGSDNRNSRVKGKSILNDFRISRIKGFSIISEIRNARIKGKNTTSNIRNARILGKALGNDFRLSRILGKNLLSESRNARSKGKATFSDNRASRIKGLAITNSDRQSRTLGKSLISESRSSRVKGFDILSKSIFARIKGIAITSSNILGRLVGKDTAESIIGGHTLGKITISSVRNAITRGIEIISDNKFARVIGKLTTESSIVAKTKGKVTVFSSLLARVIGVSTISNSRGAKTKGRGDLFTNKSGLYSHGNNLYNNNSGGIYNKNSNLSNDRGGLYINNK